MKTVNKIMVAYDGSDHAIQELKYGCSLASSLQSELIIALVIHRRDVEPLCPKIHRCWHWEGNWGLKWKLSLESQYTISV